MMDAFAARQAVIRRWFQVLQPFRVAVVGGGSRDANAVLDLGRQNDAPRRVWADVLPSRLRPTVARFANGADLHDCWDLAFALDFAQRSPADAQATLDELRWSARFVVAAIPVQGPNGWSAAIRRRLQPLCMQAFAGEELCLLRGGETSEVGDQPRVWYLAPNRHIYGGVKILYNHVDMLRSIGIDAAVAVDGPTNWPAQWFPWNPQALAFGADIRDAVGPEDVVVIPEFRDRDAVLFPQAKRRLLFVQNQGLAGGMGRWKRLGYDGVLTLGRPDGVPSYLEEHLFRRRCQLPMFAIPNHFDDDGWSEVKRRKERGSILCLPRKGPEFVARIVKEFGSAVTCVENLHQLEMAAAYSRADVYVHTGFPEGLGMPIVESMLTGGVACGFAGGGGLDVMSDGRTAYLAADGDMEELLTAVRRALRSPCREEVRENGALAAERFTRAAAQSALEQCYRRWLPNLPQERRAAAKRRSFIANAFGR